MQQKKSASFLGRMRFVQGHVNMKMKLLVIGLTALALIACNKQDQADKPDFRKAAQLNVEMGEAYLAQGQIARAKQKFIHALELQPKLPEAHSSFGYFYESVGDVEEAENHYQRAISFGNGNGKFYNNYGTFLCRQGRYDEADKAFKNALRDKKYIKTAEVYENAGVNMVKKKDLKKAREYLETALKRDPYRANVILELARLELESKNYLLAKSYLENYKNNNQQQSAKSVLLSLQLNKALGNKDAVASDLLRLKNMFPNSAEYKQYLETQANG